MNSKKLKRMQERFLEVFRRNEDYGEMNLTCKTTNIPGFVVLGWLQNDSFFYERIEEIKDEKQWMLAELAKKGDLEACMKFLSIYAKDRGYGGGI